MKRELACVELIGIKHDLYVVLTYQFHELKNDTRLELVVMK